jgi:hypothetical protein
MIDSDLVVHVLARLWFLSKAQGVEEFEFKARAEELLFCYAKMQMSKPHGEGEK